MSLHRKSFPIEVWKFHNCTNIFLDIEISLAITSRSEKSCWNYSVSLESTSSANLEMKDSLLVLTSDSTESV